MSSNGLLTHHSAVIMGNPSGDAVSSLDGQNNSTDNLTTIRKGYPMADQGWRINIFKMERKILYPDKGLPELLQEIIQEIGHRIFRI